MTMAPAPRVLPNVVTIVCTLRGQVWGQRGASVGLVWGQCGASVGLVWGQCGASSGKHGIIVGAMWGNTADCAMYEAMA